jgi:TM2 domain-containing membrane protein YozV
MSQAWYYAKNNERHGPVPLAELRSLIASGGLQPGDLVWSEHLPGWVPARKVRELYPKPSADLVPGIKVPGPRVASPKQPATQPPAAASRPAGQNRPQPSRGTAGGPAFDWNDLRPRHWLAGGGAFLAALGIAFTAIARSPVSLAFTLGGLTLAALGLYAEIGRLLAQAIENIGKASQAAADRRHEAKKLAVEKQRLDLEAKRLAHEQARLEQAGRHQTLAPQSPPAAEDEHDHDLEGPQATPGRTIVINHPPIQRWSPALAAVLSFFLPGLGQLYKGQILNGIVWFFMVGLGYMALILPGLVLHLFCIIGAASGNPWTEGKTTVVRE